MAQQSHPVLRAFETRHLQNAPRPGCAQNTLCGKSCWGSASAARKTFFPQLEAERSAAAERAQPERICWNGEQRRGEKKKRQRYSIMKTKILQEERSTSARRTFPGSVRKPTFAAPPLLVSGRVTLQFVSAAAEQKRGSELLPDAGVTTWEPFSHPPDQCVRLRYQG